MDIKHYEKILDELEELDSIRAYDRAKASGDEILPFEKAVKEIERERAQKCQERVPTGK